MQETIIAIMNQFGYLGVGLLIAIENLFPPIPSEVILTFGGFMTTYSRLNVWGVILAATIGADAGAMILYGVGRLIKPETLQKLLDGQAGRILRLKGSDVIKAERWFERRGKLTVFFCRFIPVIRSLISIPAGSARMNIGIFLLLTTIGSAIWNTVLVQLGAYAGDSWERIVEIFNTYSHTMYVLIAVVFVALVVIHFYRSRKSRRPA